MMTPRTRRDFLAQVGQGMLVTTLGCEVAAGLGLGTAFAGEESDELSFGSLEPLVRMMQETPVKELLPRLAAELGRGTELRRLVAAAALANARTFGGEDYIGFHTMMALAPALHMSEHLDSSSRALPVFKVLYRNTNRIQENGGRQKEVLHAIKPGKASASQVTGEALRELVRQKNVQGAEALLAFASTQSPEEAFNDLLFAVQDETEVHRVVLPYRAWDLLGLIGKEQAQTLLRQSVRYCVKAESWPRTTRRDEPRSLLPRLLEEHKLLNRSPGTRAAEDAWIEEFSQTIFKSTPEQAAEAAATVLAEGMLPADVGCAITLAANQLILRDMGRRPSEEISGKPIGSVHGDSIGVHACDSANAWRNMARVSNSRNCFASLILGAYQVALDRVNRGGDFLNWQPLPLARHVELVKTSASSEEELLRDLDAAIRSNLQAQASAIVHQYGLNGFPARRVFDLLLRYAISEDGALHAEKFYCTVSEEFAAARPAFRWRHLVALARVTASEFGRPAPGIAEARSLLKV